MEKAKFIGRSVARFPVRGVHPVYLTYAYRGHEYTVVDMKTGINDLRDQHWNQQRLIDEWIERFPDGAKPEPYDDSAERAFGKLMDFFETGEWNDEQPDLLHA